MITPTSWNLVHVDLVDASGTEQGFDNKPVGAIRTDDIGVYLQINGVITLYPWHRVLAVEFERNDNVATPYV